MRPRGARVLDEVLGAMLRGTDMLLERRGVRWTYRLLRATSPGWWRHGEGRGRAIAVRVRRAAGHNEAIEADVSCLRQALVTFWLLRWGAGDPVLIIGFRSEAGRGYGHAWVEVDDVVVGDEASVGEQYPIRLGGDFEPAS